MKTTGFSGFATKLNWNPSVIRPRGRRKIRNIRQHGAIKKTHKIKALTDSYHLRQFTIMIKLFFNANLYSTKQWAICFLFVFYTAQFQRPFPLNVMKQEHTTTVNWLAILALLTTKLVFPIHTISFVILSSSWPGRIARPMARIFFSCEILKKNGFLFKNVLLDIVGYHISRKLKL